MPLSRDLHQAAGWGRRVGGHAHAAMLRGDWLVPELLAGSRWPRWQPSSLPHCMLRWLPPCAALLALLALTAGCCPARGCPAPLHRRRPVSQTRQPPPPPRRCCPCRPTPSGCAVQAGGLHLHAGGRAVGGRAGRVGRLRSLCCAALLHSAALCSAALCYAVLCCAVLCCAVLCCAVLWHRPQPAHVVAGMFAAHPCCVVGKVVGFLHDPVCIRLEWDGVEGNNLQQQRTEGGRAAPRMCMREQHSGCAQRRHAAAPPGHMACQQHPPGSRASHKQGP